MMREKVILIAAIIALVTISMSAAPAFAENEINKINDCIDVVKAIKAIPEEGIPTALLNNAQGIVISPGVIKVGFVIGGRYGTGVLTVRDEHGN